MVLGVLGLCVLVRGETPSAEASREPMRSPVTDPGQPGEHSMLDTGWVENTEPGTGMQRVFCGWVSKMPAMWLRLHFDMATLSGEIGDANASYLQLTSEADGAVQVLYAEHLVQWAGSSAYFNGDRVRVEIFAAPGTGPSRVRLGWVEYGEPGYLDRSLCGSTDDRVEVNDPRSARLLPGQCTAWLVNDMPYGLVTAGHCAMTAASVVEFNVPRSTIGGSMVHPPPEDQYAVDPMSIQNQSGAQSTGNDWKTFGVFENCNTGLSPLEAQGSTFHTATSLPPNDGRAMRVGGFGQVFQPMPLELNFVYTEHVGPYVGGAGNVVRYQVDTTGGDSGAAVVDEVTGLAVGVHTNGGCNSSGSNKGTATAHPDLQQALQFPRGTAARSDGVLITFPRGRPAEIDPAGGTSMRVRFRRSSTRSPRMETATLHVLAGGSWTSVPMTQATESVSLARFPSIDSCVPLAEFYVNIENSLGEIDTLPRGAPARLYETRVAHPGAVVFQSDMDASDGWAGVAGESLLSGEWKSAAPNGGGRGAPSSDFDGTGSCGLTGPKINEDVDGGPAMLISPPIDTIGTVDPVLSYAAWYVSTALDPQDLIVEICPDESGNWALLDSIGPTDGWEVRVHRLREIVPVSSELRLRFRAADDPNTAIVEAAVDRVRIDDHACPSCGGDLDGDGQVDQAEFEHFATAIVEGDAAGDLNGDGAVDASDVLSLLASFGGECP